LKRPNNFKPVIAAYLVFAMMICLSATAQASDPIPERTNVGNTAKSYLGTAVRAAREWQADARLRQVLGMIRFSGVLLSCDPEDPRNGWQFYFNSPKTHRELRVTICGETIVPEEVGGDRRQEKEFIDETFIDTDEVGRIVKGLLDRQDCPTRWDYWEGRLRFDPNHSKPMWVAEVLCDVTHFLDVTVDPITGTASWRLREEIP
jgi:hypothetical protein